MTRPDSQIIAAAEAHAQCSMAEITSCIVCGRDLSWQRDHVDTCGGSCFERVRRLQREQAGESL